VIFERIKSPGLAHNSYFVGSGSSAAVIDPRRDVQVYEELAAKHEVRIKYVLETHRNEDYVIGSLQLAQVTGAEIFHGPGLDWHYGENLKDAQEFALGRMKLTALSTPGHSDESVSFVLRDLRSGTSPVMLFSGDALFVGDTGRVDLLGSSETQRMAAGLYDSLFNRLLPLGDGVILCPAHGAGSLCGANIADRDESTLGIEKQQNSALRDGGKAEFIAHKTAERLERPPYFGQMEKYNRYGPPLLKGFQLPPPLTASDFKRELDNGASLLDTTMPAGFGAAHIAGSYGIWLEGVSYFPGWFLRYDKPILLVLEDPLHLETAVSSLRRLGYDNVVGYLKGGIEGWYNAGLPMESLTLLSVGQLKEKIERGEDLLVLDVRDDAEWNMGHIRGSFHIYVGHIEERLAEIPAAKPVAVLCSVGHRASLAASLLKRKGYKNVSVVLGSITAWRNAGYPLVKD
jgi:hydroxyacylglutathione hydrolase